MLEHDDDSGSGHLDIKHTELSADLIKCIQRVILFNDVKKLDLWNCGLGEEGAMLLARAIEGNSVITILNIGMNGLGDRGCRELTNALVSCSSLHSLILERNGISDKGGEELSALVSTNAVVSHLDLKSNHLGDATALAFANGIIDNTALRSLDLRCNFIGHKGLAALIEAVKENTTLSHIEISDNPIRSKVLLQSLRSLLRSRSTSRDARCPKARTSRLLRASDSLLHRAERIRSRLLPPSSPPQRHRNPHPAVNILPVAPSRRSPTHRHGSPSSPQSSWDSSDSPERTLSPTRPALSSHQSPSPQRSHWLRTQVPLDLSDTDHHQQRSSPFRGPARSASPPAAHASSPTRSAVLARTVRIMSTRSAPATPVKTPTNATSTSQQLPSWERGALIRQRRTSLTAATQPTDPPLRPSLKSPMAPKKRPRSAAPRLPPEHGADESMSLRFLRHSTTSLRQRRGRSDSSTTAPPNHRSASPPTHSAPPPQPPHYLSNSHLRASRDSLVASSTTSSLAVAQASVSSLPDVSLSDLAATLAASDALRSMRHHRSCDSSELSRVLFDPDYEVAIAGHADNHPSTAPHPAIKSVASSPSRPPVRGSFAAEDALSLTPRRSVDGDSYKAGVRLAAPAGRGTGSSKDDGANIERTRVGGSSFASHPARSSADSPARPTATADPWASDDEHGAEDPAAPPSIARSARSSAVLPHRSAVAPPARLPSSMGGVQAAVSQDAACQADDMEVKARMQQLQQLVVSKDWEISYLNEHVEEMREHADRSKDDLDRRARQLDDAAAALEALRRDKDDEIARLNDELTALHEQHERELADLLSSENSTHMAQHVLMRVESMMQKRETLQFKELREQAGRGKLDVQRLSEALDIARAQLTGDAAEVNQRILDSFRKFEVELEQRDQQLDRVSNEHALVQHKLDAALQRAEDAARGASDMAQSLAAQLRQRRTELGDANKALHGKQDALQRRIHAARHQLQRACQPDALHPPRMDDMLRVQTELSACAWSVTDVDRQRHLAASLHSQVAVLTTAAGALTETLHHLGAAAVPELDAALNAQPPTVPADPVPESSLDALASEVRAMEQEVASLWATYLPTGAAAIRTGQVDAGAENERLQQELGVARERQEELSQALEANEARFAEAKGEMERRVRSIQDDRDNALQQRRETDTHLQAARAQLHDLQSQLRAHVQAAERVVRQSDVQVPQLQARNAELEAEVARLRQRQQFEEHAAQELQDSLREDLERERIVNERLRHNADAATRELDDLRSAMASASETARAQRRHLRTRLQQRADKAFQELHAALAQRDAELAALRETMQAQPASAMQGGQRTSYASTPLRRDVSLLSTTSAPSIADLDPYASSLAATSHDTPLQASSPSTEDLPDASVDDSIAPSDAVPPAPSASDDLEARVLRLREGAQMAKFDARGTRSRAVRVWLSWDNLARYSLHVFTLNDARPARAVALVDIAHVLERDAPDLRPLPLQIDAASCFTIVMKETPRTLDLAAPDPHVCRLWVTTLAQLLLMLTSNDSS